MRITIFGAAGNVGRRVVAEALDRGHEVTAVTRDRARFADLPEATVALAGDAGNVKDVAELSAGQNLVISATARRPAMSANSLRPRKRCWLGSHAARFGCCSSAVPAA